MRATILTLLMIVLLQLESLGQELDTAQLISQIPLITLDGKEKRIQDYKGKYTLIDFWGLGCKPCIDNAPKLVALQEKYRDKLAIVGINDSIFIDRMDKFTSENKINYDIVHIDSKALNKSYGTAYMEVYHLFSNGKLYGWPFYILLDREGQIVARRTRPHLVDQIFEEGSLK